MKWLLLIVLGIFALAAGQARADTDYQCLKACVTSGKPSSSCMPQCTYAPPSQKGSVSMTTKKTDYLANHRVLSPLNPVGQDEVVIQKKDPSYHETKDYACVSRCLQNKMQYQTCSDSCTLVTNSHGDVVTNPNDKSFASETLMRQKQMQVDKAVDNSVAKSPNAIIPKIGAAQ